MLLHYSDRVTEWESVCACHYVFLSLIQLDTGKCSGRESTQLNPSYQILCTGSSSHSHHNLTNCLFSYTSSIHFSLLLCTLVSVSCSFSKVLASLHTEWTSYVWCSGGVSTPDFLLAWDIYFCKVRWLKIYLLLIL